VSPAEERHEILERLGSPRHLRAIRHDAKRAEHVVRVLRAVLREAPFEDDGCGFVDLELRALDEIREVGLEERKVSLLARSFRLRAVNGSFLQKVGVQPREEVEALRIVGLTRCPRASGRGAETSLARPEERSQERVELRELPHESQLRSKLACRVAERVHVAFPTGAQVAFEPLLDLAARQAPGDALAGPRLGHVLEVCAGPACHVEAEEGGVADERAAPSSCAESGAGQDDVARDVRGQEDRAVRRRAGFEGRSVGDDGAGKDEGRDLPEEALDEELGRLVNAGRVERGSELAEPSVPQTATDA